MNTLLLSAGMGRRLGYLTNNKPKCLIKIGDKPLIDIWIAKTLQLNVNQIFINTHYKARQISQHLSITKKKNIKILYEKNLLGTAGTVLHNIDLFLQEDLLLIHTDNYTNFNLKALKEAHNLRPSSCDVTMLIFKTDKPAESGIVKVNKQKILIEYFQKVQKPPSNLANGAVYILSKRFLLNYRKNFSKCKDFAEDVIPQLINKVYTHKTNKFFIDIGTHKSLLTAKSWIKKNQ